MEFAHLRNDRAPATLLTWTPLVAGGLNSYGPVAFNYGFALYFLNYRHGFVKRGLVGELCSWLAYMPRERLLATEYIFLGVAFALTYGVFRQILSGTLPERKLAAALLGAPALLPHLGYLFAQPDVTLYILTLGCLWAFLRLRPSIAAVASCILCCIGLLGHEAFCLMFYPLIVAILLHLCLRFRLPWLAGAAHVLVVFAVFAAVIHWGALKISPDALLQEAQARTDVGIQRQVFDVMASNFSQQEALVRRMYTSGVLRVLGLTLLLSVPYFVLLARLLNESMRKAGCLALQRICTPALCALPLLLCALGHDTTRWIGAMCINATFFLFYLYLTEPQDGLVRRYLKDWASGPLFLPWLVYLILIGPYGATGLRSADQVMSALYGP
jgi:membrane protein implicated in regulation of membrane protease activity